MPHRAHEGDSGYDLFADVTRIVLERSRALIPTGVSLEIPRGYEAQVRSRSGLALKGLSVSNSPGTIDSCYRGEIWVIMENHTDECIFVTKGMKVAQLVFQKVEEVEFERVRELEETDRGEGGFGSTGK